jgi:hypothetical protein
VKIAHTAQVATVSTANTALSDMAVSRRRSSQVIDGSERIGQLPNRSSIIGTPTIATANAISALRPRTNRIMALRPSLLGPMLLR